MSQPGDGRFEAAVERMRTGYLPGMSIGTGGNALPVRPIDAEALRGAMLDVFPEFVCRSFRDWDAVARDVIEAYERITAPPDREDMAAMIAYDDEGDGT